MSSLAQRTLPKHLRDEIQRYLDAHNKFRADGGVASAKTQHERAGEIFRAYAALWKLGFRVKKPESVSSKHIHVLTKHWDEAGVSAATIHTRLSNLRTFFNQWMNRPGLVKDLCDYLPPERVKRTSIAKEDLSWEAKGVDPLKIIERATAFDERFGAMLTLQHYFALRVKESIEIRPGSSLIDNGEAIELHLGTKGGRPRRVAIKTAEQRLAFDFARRVAAKGKSGRLRWPNCNWQKAQDRFYYFMKKHGITKKDLGVTAHGLRHGGAQKWYEDETGYPSPIKGGALGLIDRETHLVASVTIARALGHGRIDVAPSYYGSYGHALRVPPNQYKFTFEKLQ